MTPEGDGRANGFRPAGTHDDIAGAEWAIEPFADPGKDRDVVAGIKSDEFGFPVALVRFNLEGELGGDRFDAGQGTEGRFDSRIQRGGAGLAGEESGGEVMGDGLGEDEDVRAEAVEGVFEPLLDGLAKDQGKKNGGGSDRHRGRKQKNPARTAAHLLKKKTPAKGEERQGGVV